MLKLLVVRHAGQQLQQQAFAQVSGADAGRVQFLHQPERPLGQRQILVAGVRAQQVLQPPLQIPVGIEVVDDAVGHRPQVRRQVEPAQLVVEVILQRLGPGDHVGHRVELAFAGLLDLAPRRMGALLEVVRPLLVHLHQPLEILLVRVGLVDHQFAFFLAGGVGRLTLLQLGPLGGKLRLLLHQLEHRILFHLLLDPFLERQDRQLQNLHRLDHPRRQHLLLHESEVLAER